MLLTKPHELFHDAHSYKNTIQIIASFSLVIVLVKSLFRTSSYHNFFAQNYLNQILNFLSIPFVLALLSVFLHILLIFVISKLAGRFSKTTSFETLLLALMAISPLAAISHVLFPVLRLMPSSDFWFVFSALKSIIYCVVLILTFVAIKVVAVTSINGALIVTIISTLPFILIGWFGVISPYFIYL